MLGQPGSQAMGTLVRLGCADRARGVVQPLNETISNARPIHQPPGHAMSHSEIPGSLA